MCAAANVRRDIMLLLCLSKTKVHTRYQRWNYSYTVNTHTRSHIQFTQYTTGALIIIFNSHEVTLFILGSTIIVCLCPPPPPPKGWGTILNLQLQHYNNSCFVNEYKLHNMSLFILRGQKMQRQKKQPKNLTKLKAVNPKIKHTTTSQMYYMYYNWW